MQETKILIQHAIDMAFTRLHEAHIIEASTFSLRKLILARCNQRAFFIPPLRSLHQKIYRLLS